MWQSLDSTFVVEPSWRGRSWMVYGMAYGMVCGMVYGIVYGMVYGGGVCTGAQQGFGRAILDGARGEESQSAGGGWAMMRER